MCSGISIIDDDIGVCNVLEKTLEKNYPKVDVSTFTDYTKFLSNYEKHKHDIVILDYELNGATALDLVQYIEAINPDVTIFIISTYFKHEGEFCIPKPFNACRLSEKIFKKQLEYKGENIKKMMMLDAILNFIDSKADLRAQQIS